MSFSSAPKTIAGKPVGPIGYGLMSELRFKLRQCAVTVAKHHLHSPHAFRWHCSRRGHQANEGRFGKRCHFLERCTTLARNVDIKYRLTSS